MTQAATERDSMIAYRPLFRIEARCEYFEDGLCRDLLFNLTPASAALVHNRGLLVRITPAGISVFAAPSGPGDTTAQDEVLPLTFKVVPRDAGFGNYADLDGRQMDSVFHFDTSLAVADGEDGALRLHPEPWACAANRIPLNAAVLKDVLDARERLAPPLAVISMPLKTSELSGTRGVATYFMAFRARKTLWKYYVLGADHLNGPLSIRDADGAIEFASMPEGPLAPGDKRRAVTLLSNRPIALQERPKHRFQLRANTPGDGKVLIRRLAVASPHQHAKEIVNGREVAVSEIYINL